ncbi:MAG: hypothetical protein ACK5B6_12620 [Bacteroidia bacterium]|jgi:uncharacterized membrane protein
MIHLLFKDFLNNLKAKQDAAAQLTSDQIKHELKVKYIIPEIDIPIEYQLNCSKEVHECCIEEGVTVPVIAQKKFELLERMKKMGGGAMLVNFIICIYIAFSNADDELSQFGVFGALFSKALWIGLFSFVCGVFLIVIINKIILVQFDMDMKKTQNQSNS